MVNLINLMQEFERLSIREAAIKVGLSNSTATRKIKEWNEMINSTDQGSVSDTIGSKEHKSRRLILKDIHTVFILEILANEPNLTVEAVTDQFCENFKEIQMTPRSIATHKKKGAVSLINALSSNTSHETVRKLLLKDMIQNMHRSYGWCEVGPPCKIKVGTRGSNVSILGAISKDGLTTLSRKEIITTAAAGKRQRTDDTPAIKGATTGMNYKYLVLGNASIHRANLVRDWVEQRGYQILFLPPYSPFLNPIEEFWPNLKML
ncbi:hypothetical protein G6F52_002794 [Rhizopus delemar]|nr:hypothetical protein G6F52_002794 [Rhizopus delemar]